MSAEVQEVKQTPKATLKAWLEGDAFRKAITQVLPKHCSAERFARLAILAGTRIKDLDKCTQASVLQCLMDMSRMGLEPDGRRAHLIPFKRNKKDARGQWESTYECTLIVDYKGLVELAYRSGKVANVSAEIVCDNDTFEYDRGIVTKHSIDFRNPRGEMYAVWARCVMKDGAEQFVVMSRHDVDMIRERSRSKDSGPWVTDYYEMAKKTAFRRLSKWLPLSDEWREAAEYGDEEEFSVAHSLEIKKPLFNRSDLPAIEASTVEELPDMTSEQPETVAVDAPFGGTSK